MFGSANDRASSTLSGNCRASAAVVVDGDGGMGGTDSDLCVAAASAGAGAAVTAAVDVVGIAAATVAAVLREASATTDFTLPLLVSI